MADKNKEDYREYAKLVLTEMYERTEDNLDYGDWLEGMIRHQMMLNNSTDRSLGYEEVVCVASELMLANEPILKGIARGNLFTKLIQWLEMFRDKIKKLFEGTDFADNRFAKATMETVESWYNSLYNTSLVENTENGKTKYSISEESENNFRNRNYIENNVKIVANMDSVATIKNISGLFKRNTELNSAKNTLKNIFLNFKNPLFNKEIGEVYANGKSANDIISHKVTLTKLMVATKLPILVEKGKVVDYSLMKDGKTKKGNQRYAHRVVLACPITIADTEYKGKYLVGIVVKIKENNKVYLEEVVEIKMENALPLKQTTFSNNMLTNGESDSPSVIKILQNILSVKFDNKSVKKSVADSEGNKLTKEQIEYFKDSKVRDENGDLLVMYHGTPNGTFNTFRSGTYFTQNKEYADIYQNTGASSLSVKTKAENPYTYKVYLNITKPFDTRLSKVKKIWDEQYFRKYGNGTPLSEKGLPDWVEGLDIIEFIEDNNLDFDGIVLDEGATGGYGEEVKSRGISYVVRNAEQIKDITNKKPTPNVDIRYSKSDEYVNFSEFEKYDIIDYNIPKEFRNAKIKNADLQYEEFESVRSTIFRKNVEREKNGEGLTYSSVAYTGMHSFDYHNYSLTDFTVKVIKTLEEEYGYDDKRAKEYISNSIERQGVAIQHNKRASKLSGDGGTSQGNDRLSSDGRGKNGNGSNLENGRDNRDRRLRYSMSDEVSDREILSSALMDITTTADEKNVLLNYKRAIGKLEEAEKKLAEYNLKKREAFLKGNKEELKKYTALASKEQNTLDWWDKRLLSLQNTRSLKRLLNSERQKAKKKQESKFKTLIADYKKEIRTKEETAKIRNSISNKVKRINKLIINEQDNKNVKQGIKPLVVDFVRIFLNDNSVFTNSQLNKLISVYDGLYRNLTGEDYTADFEAMGLYDIDFKNEVLRLQETIDGKSLNQLTTDELKVVKDIVDEIDFLIKSENALFDDYRKRSVGQVASEITREINFEKQTNKAQDLERKIRYANTTPIYFFKHLGKTMLGLYDKFRDGQDKNTILVNENQKWMENTKERFNYKVWSEDKFVAPNGSKTLKQLEKYGLTVEQALSIYATYKREQIVGTHHIDEGGITFKENKGVLAKGKNVSHKVVLTLNDVQAITNSLTYEQLAYADEVVNYLSHDMAELGNEVSMSLFGIKKFNENYYFPMASDANFMYQDINNEVRSDSRIVHKSFTKPLTANSNNPIEIFDFTDVAVNHINGMITYYSFAVPLTNFNRVMNHKTEDGTYDVRKAVEGAYGKEALNYINQFLVDLNGGIRSDSSEKLVNQLISRFKSQAVLASMSVVVQQPSSIGRAFALIDGKYFLNSRIKKGSYQECIKYAPIARLKQIGSFDTSLLM